MNTDVRSFFRTSLLFTIDLIVCLISYEGFMMLLTLSMVYLIFLSPLISPDGLLSHSVAEPPACIVSPRADNR